jgi:hypothetical protein
MKIRLSWKASLPRFLPQRKRTSGKRIFSTHGYGCSA